MNVAVFSQVSEMVRALWGPLIKSLVQTEFLFSYSISFRVPRFYRTGPVGVLISLSVQSVCSWFVLSGKTSCCKVSSGKQMQNFCLHRQSHGIFCVEFAVVSWWRSVSVTVHQLCLFQEDSYVLVIKKKPKDPVSSQGYCYLELCTLHMFHSLCSASKLCLKS